MKVVIPGGAGQVGSILARAFHADGHDVVVFSRTPRPAAWRTAAWDGETIGAWISELEGADVVVNLAGRSVNCRYHAKNRRLIVDSRIKSTQVIGRAIARVSRPPRLWLQASTATIYAHRFDAANDEATGIIGGAETDTPETWKFSIDVATAWEQACNKAVVPHTRKVLLRSAMIMSPDHGGVFDALLRLVRFGVGGRFGDGRHFMSWIHGRDFVRAVQWIMDHEELDGAINVCAPNPLINADFMRDLRCAWRIPYGIPSPGWLLEIGAAVIRTETELLLKSRRVVPGRLVHSGFAFQFPSWPEAAADLCASWVSGRNSRSQPGPRNP
jgi:uncharacterized protein (TIGR01777 family)